MQSEHIFNHENLSSFTKISDITASDSLLLKQASEIYDISLGQFLNSILDRISKLLQYFIGRLGFNTLNFFEIFIISRDYAVL